MIKKKLFALCFKMIFFGKEYFHEVDVHFIKIAISQCWCDTYTRRIPINICGVPHQFRQFQLWRPPISLQISFLVGEGLLRPKFTPNFFQICLIMSYIIWYKNSARQFIDISLYFLIIMKATFFLFRSHLTPTELWKKKNQSIFLFEALITNIIHFFHHVESCENHVELCGSHVETCLYHRLIK